MKHFDGKHENAVILTADTIAYSGRRIIDKTNDEVIARKNLNKLSGRRHRVSTVLCLRDIKNKVISRSVTTTVNFKLLNKKDIDNYIKTNEWKNVAGSYKIQGFAEVFIKSINGSYSNVVGLPLFQTNNLLGSVGLIKS
jgi:septum formation protein